MENTLIGAASRPNLIREAARAQQLTFSRWLIPIGGGMLAAFLIVIGTPHVAWDLRLFLGGVAFLYIGGQSPAHLCAAASEPGCCGARRLHFVHPTK